MTINGNTAPCVVEMLEQRVLLSVSANLYDVHVSSYIGGTGTDSVRGSIIQSDGTIVLAANISDATPGGATSVLLNGATESSSGAVIRLSSDGTTVLSVTRISGMVLDLAADAAGNLYVACWTDGAVKLNADASAVVWSKSAVDLGFANVQRIDAGPLGWSAVLGGGSLDDGSTLGDNVRLFEPDGTYSGGWTSGKWKNDVAIDESSQTIITLGFRNANSGGLPVQIAYYQGNAYDGTVKYKGYDWSTNESDPNYLNKYTNNMADTRGYRCAIGADGMLYLAFESAGGNTIFRWDPFDISQPATVAGGDAWNSAYNISAQHITNVGRYDPATGEQIVNQVMLTRNSNGSGNTCRIFLGSLTADEQGRVYIGGNSAWGLPLPTHPAYTFNAQRPAFNPGVDGNYLGGAWFAVFDPTLTNRLYTTRTAGGTTHAVAARTLAGGGTQIVFAGKTTGEVYVTNGIQTASGGGQDGWFSVIPDSLGNAANNAPNADFFAYTTVNGSNITYYFNATGSEDADGDPLTYIWHFGNGNSATGANVEQTFPLSQSTVVTLTVLDPTTGWSHAYYSIGSPTARFTSSTRAGEAPATISFNASATTSPNQDPAELDYFWDFGDGVTASGMIVDHAFARGGVFSVKLTVTDANGAYHTADDIIAIAQRGGVQKRFDFGPTGSTVASGYTLAPLELYSSETGFGWEYINSDFSASSYDIADAMFKDYVQFSKYPNYGLMEGTFLADVPNGEYMVLARFSHKYSQSFPGLMIEGVRQTGTVSAGPNQFVTGMFRVKVEDGQLEMTLFPANEAPWYICGLEIIDVGPALVDAGSFTIDPNFGQFPLRVVFDAGGVGAFGADKLNYSWDFGDGNFGAGQRVVHVYETPGVYTATLTVTGGEGNQIVSFGGDYRTSNLGLSGIFRKSGLDLDGDGLFDDALAGVGFSLAPTAPMVIANSNKPSARIYGGISSFRLDSTSTTSFSDAGIINSAENDYFGLRDQNYPPMLEHRAAVMWIKEEFLNGGHAQQVYFDASSSMSVNFTRWENLTAGRWIVQDGDVLYVSEATFSGSGTKTIDPNATNWAVYTPMMPYHLDFDQAAAEFAAHTFTDIQSVGILLEQDGKAGGARVWYNISSFQAAAAFAPATATVTVVEDYPTVDATATTAEAFEQDAVPGQFVITRTGDVSAPLAVKYELVGTAGLYDYVTSIPREGYITIPAGAGSVTIVITPMDDTVIEGAETVILQLRPQGTYVIGDGASATVTIADNDMTPLVDFGQNYGSAGVTLKPGEGGGAGTLIVGDLNGDEVNDVIRAYTFSTTTPMSPTIKDGVYSGPSAVFYGGVVGTAYGVSTGTFSDKTVSNGTPYDYINIRWQPVSGTTWASFDTVFFWQAEDFLAGESPLTLGANSVLQIGIQRWERLGAARWLLGDGENFYVSGQTFTGSSTFTGDGLAGSMWALYSPEGVNVDFDQVNAVFNIPLSDIAVTQVGFITDADNGDTGRHWIQVNEFRVFEGDNKAPQVTQVNKNFDVQGSVVEATLDVTFSETVYVNGSDIQVLDAADQAVDFTWQYSIADRSLRIVVPGLTDGQTYRLVLADTITDENDNRLDGEFMGLGQPSGDGVEGGTFDMAFVAGQVETAAIVGRHVFYNNSYFDNNDAGASLADDAAVDPGKSPLLPGETANSANYTSYSKGINGIMIDVADLGATELTAGDFIFRAGNTSDIGSWGAAPAPLSITIRPGAGADSSDRVTIIWADAAIVGSWLEVTALSDAAGGSAGLASDDVFYFANLPADFNSDGTVGGGDASLLLSVWGQPAPTPVSTGDATRDGTVSGGDASVFLTWYDQSLPSIAPLAMSAPDSEPVELLAVSEPMFVTAAASGEDYSQPAKRVLPQDLRLVPVSAATRSIRPVLLSQPPAATRAYDNALSTIWQPLRSTSQMQRPSWLDDADDNEDVLARSKVLTRLGI